METIGVIQEATAMGNWLAVSSWQWTCSCITSHGRVFLKNIKSPRWLSPCNSPDLESCDFWLFPKLESPLKGKRFQTIDEIQENTMRQLMVILTKDFAECFQQWKRHWENCMRSKGAYLEGDWGVIVLCTMFLISCIFFNKCLFHSTWLDTLWTDSYAVHTNTDNSVGYCWDSLSSILVIVQWAIFVAVNSLWNHHKPLPFQVECDLRKELKVI